MTKDEVFWGLAGLVVLITGGQMILQWVGDCLDLRRERLDDEAAIRREERR